MIKKKLSKNAKKVDQFLSKFLKKQKQSLLVKPMKYGVISGGKKIRSTVILDTGKIFNVKEKKLLNICAAVECIHSYSLIHDDLPCMDNDAVRRGKPSTHIKFGEASAVLAGSSLLTLAFEIISDTKYLINDKTKNEIIRSLASCSGHTGIAGGQFLDLSYEKRKVPLSQILNMQKKKTGKLFEFCCLAPAIISGSKNSIKKQVGNLGEEIGLLFQIADDFLDLRGRKKNVGKPVNKDSKKGKSTLIKSLGYNRTLKFALSRKKLIISKLEKYGNKSKDLIQVVNFILDRSY